MLLMASAIDLSHPKRLNTDHRGDTRPSNDDSRITRDVQTQLLQ